MIAIKFRFCFSNHLRERLNRLISAGLSENEASGLMVVVYCDKFFLLDMPGAFEWN